MAPHLVVATVPWPGVGWNILGVTGLRESFWGVNGWRGGVEGWGGGNITTLVAGPYLPPPQYWVTIHAIHAIHAIQRYSTQPFQSGTVG